MNNKFGYDEFHLESDLKEALEKYGDKDFEKWLEASLIVQANKGELNYSTSYFIPERNENGKVEFVLHIHEEYQSCGEVDLDYLFVELIHLVVHKSTADKVLDYIKENPGSTKKQIIAGTGLKREYQVHNALGEICYRKHLVEEVSGPETGYKLVAGTPQDVATRFRNASNTRKICMLTEETDVYKLKDMLKTLTGGFSSPAFNIQDNVNALIGPNWPKPLIMAKELLAKEYGNMWAYAGD